MKGISFKTITLILSVALVVTTIPPDALALRPISHRITFQDNRRSFTVMQDELTSELSEQRIILSLESAQQNDPSMLMMSPLAVYLWKKAQERNKIEVLNEAGFCFKYVVYDSSYMKEVYAKRFIRQLRRQGYSRPYIADLLEAFSTLALEVSPETGLHQGQVVCVVNGDSYNTPLSRGLMAVHEYIEVQLRPIVGPWYAHIYANYIEMAVADRRGRLNEYLKWLHDNKNSRYVEICNLYSIGDRVRKDTIDMLSDKIRGSNWQKKVASNIADEIARKGEDYILRINLGCFQHEILDMVVAGDIIHRHEDRSKATKKSRLNIRRPYDSNRTIQSVA